jgi:hypothetical protein
VANMISKTKHHEGIARVRERESKPTRLLLRSAGMTVFAALLGYAESKGALPAGVLKNAKGEAMIPLKLLGAAGAQLCAFATKGKVSEAFSAAGDTLGVAYGYDAGKTHALVAGD